MAAGQAYHSVYPAGAMAQVVCIGCVARNQYYSFCFSVCSIGNETRCLVRATSPLGREEGEGNECRSTLGAGRDEADQQR